MTNKKPPTDMKDYELLKRYWAVMHGTGHRKTGYVEDFYPEEEVSHRRDLERSGMRILGTFNTEEEADAALIETIAADASQNHELKEKSKYDSAQAPLARRRRRPRLPVLHL
jgi:hypothetical protein